MRGAKVGGMGNEGGMGWLWFVITLGFRDDFTEFSSWCRIPIRQITWADCLCRYLPVSLVDIVLSN